MNRRGFMKLVALTPLAGLLKPVMAKTPQDCERKDCKNYRWLGCHGCDDFWNQTACALSLESQKKRPYPTCFEPDTNGEGARIRQAHREAIEKINAGRVQSIPRPFQKVPTFNLQQGARHARICINSGYGNDVTVSFDKKVLRQINNELKLRGLPVA